MTSHKDPQARERTLLRRFFGELRQLNVLEIGCGDGRVTWLYAGSAGAVLGIDPDADGIRQAREQRPPELADRVRFQNVSFEAFDSRQRFDRILFSWSL